MRPSLLLTFLIIFASSQLVSAKSLYMTVRRDFATTEDPTIELIYSNAVPVTLRLLRPQNMKEFVSQQIDLRRAWKEPKSELNSAFFFLQGVNRTSLDFDWIREAFSARARLQVKDVFGGSENRSNGSRLFQGPTRLIRAPENFDVINEFTVNPAEKDEPKPFDVPGFDWFFSDSESMKTRIISLPAQKPGFYVLQVIQGQKEGQVILVVNDLRVAVHQTDHLAVAQVADRNGRPVGGAKVSVRAIDGNWFKDGQTDANGLLELATGEHTELVAAIEDESRGVAIVDTEFYSNVAQYPDVFLYMDRPLYKPEDSFSFKGIYRELSDGVSRIPTRRPKVNVDVVATDGAPVMKGGTVQSTDFGTFSGDFKLKDIASGVYRVKAEVEETEHVGEFRVKAYQKPLYFVNLISQQESIHAGGSLSFQVKAERYAGGIPNGVKINAELFRVRYDGPEWADDAGLGESGSKTTYIWDTQQEPVIPISIAVKEGITLDSRGMANISIPVAAQLPSLGNYDYKFLLKVSATDDDGNFAQASKTFFDSEHELLIQTKPPGVFVQQTKPARILIRALTPSGQPYGAVSGVATLSLKPFKSASHVISRQNIKTNEMGVAELDLPTQESGELVVKTDLQDNRKKVESQETSILIAPQQPGVAVKEVSSLTLLVDRTHYHVGETARGLVLLPERWGAVKSNSGLIYVTVAGRGIYKTQAVPVNGLSAWIETPIQAAYGTGVYVLVTYADPEQGWIERRLSYRIITDEKILSIVTIPTEKEIAPGLEQTLAFEVKDLSGRPVTAELSVSVVDKAVLDLQPEFRPSLIDFFYPLQRLNVMTFLSSQFQSYGYAEEIARLFKPNYWFAATKPDPEQQKEKDTAYWNPHVVTQSDGKARVSFRLPANQTIWNVSVVGVDRDGRFGEGKTEFKARTETPILIALPDAVRKGDAFLGRFVVSNLSQTATPHVNISVKAGEGMMVKEPLNVIRTLKPAEEMKIQHEFAAQENFQGETVTFESVVKIDEHEHKFLNEVKVREGTVDLPVRLPLNGETPATLELRPHETMADVFVQVSNGLSGAVIPAVQWMISYPYGCVEQVTDTTVPSLVLSQLLIPDRLQKVSEEHENFWSRFKEWMSWGWKKLRYIARYILSGGKVVALTDEQEKMLMRAHEYARAGITRLGDFQTKSGRFQWFSGIESEDESMTYFVLMSLLSVDDPALLEGVDPIKAFRSLSAYMPETSSRMFLWNYFASRLHKLKFETSSRPDIARFRFMGERALTQKDPWMQALVILAIASYEVQSENDFKNIGQPVYDALLQNLEQRLSSPGKLPAEWRLARSDWDEYPGRDASLIALSARALHAWQPLAKDLKERVIRALAQDFNGQHFGSTFETGQVLLHSAWLIRDEIENRTNKAAPRVLVNNESVSGANQDAIPSLTGWLINLKSEVFKEGKTTIALKKSGDSLDAQLVGARRVRFDDASGVESGASLTRRYFRLNPLTKKTEAFDPTKDTLSVGDLVYIEIEIRSRDANRNTMWWAPFWRSRYYVLSNDLPAGFELIENDDEYTTLAVFKEKAGWAKREIEKGRLNYYFNFDHGWMDQSTRQASLKVGYIVRANYGGRFTGGVTRFEDFYNEDIFAQTSATRMSVLSRGE